MKLKINEALKMGIEAHKAGKIEEADRLYTAILKTQPNHPDANHNLGVLAVGLGKVSESIPFFKKALEENSSIDQFWISYIGALIGLNRLSEAKNAIDEAKLKKINNLALDKLEVKFREKSRNIEEPPQELLVSILNTYNRKEYKEALIISERILKKFPHSFKIHLLIGSLQNELKQFDSAINSYKKALKIKPDYAEAYNHMGLALNNNGKPEEAIKSYQEALKIRPEYVEVLNNIGIALNERGNRKEAIEYYKEALKIKPDYAEAFNNLGIALNCLGNSKEAINSYKKALKINPEYAQAYNNLGISLYDSGLREEAIVNYKKAIKIKTNYAEAYSNLGIALKDKDMIEDAIQSYKEALKINPHYPQAYNNLGIALFYKGKISESINSYKQALMNKPDYAQVYINLGLALSEIKFKKPDPDLVLLIEKLLDYKIYARPKDIVKSAISLLKFDPIIKMAIKRHSEGELNTFLKETIAELSKVKLLLKLMSVCPIPDIELEAVFTALRSALLLSVSDMSVNTKLIDFQTALALQCFTNEYIYDQTNEEEKALKKLEKSLETKILQGKNPGIIALLCLASYKALGEYSWSHLISSQEEIEEVRIRQVIEPKTEEILKSDIPRLSKISDEVSFKVKEQYENNPYPRWVNPGLPLEPKPIWEIAKEHNLKIMIDEIFQVKEPKILIAGSGTGQHSIETAKKIKESKLLAVDLSLSSLSYAKRKTLDLGIDNIDYMQADILDLEKLGKNFDIIECGGVLHHMNDPIAGWKVLTNCLRKGGLMRIGLYSELGRKHIVRALDEIKFSVKSSTETSMRFFRDKIIKSQKDYHKWISLSDDFYSLSTLRDLLFHVQEHRFTLPQIKRSLLELGLDFCGFEDNTKRKKFKLHYSNADDIYDLDKWDLYENADPFIFANMYQFWCQKL